MHPPLVAHTRNDFAPIAASLKGAITDFYRARGEPLSTPSAQTTLAINSTLVEGRGVLLLRILSERLEGQSLEGLRIADLGCGFGALALFFAFHGAEVTAIDPNEERFAVGREVAHQHGLAVTFLTGRMERLQLPEATFDVALQNNSFCYVVDRRQRAEALVRALRALRTGGWLIARDPNRANPIDPFTGLPLIHFLSPRQTVAVARRLGRKRSLVRLRTPWGARWELRKAGFDQVHHVGDGSRLDALKVVARYHHFAARRTLP
jgi:SAM-dependent methyltransferase